ncbi:MAG: hypothetical protein WEA34_03860 [Gemmatimonadota bacterium]
MAASVVAVATRHGLGPTEVSRIERTLAEAMKPREVALSDDHHPAFLHPGRVALVLLNDVQDPTAACIELAVLIESRDPELRVADERVRAELGERIAAARAAIPSPGSEDLTERLVTLDDGAALAALAERLDHLRHEHLRDPVTPWPELVEEVSSVWLPVADRRSPTLARRYRHWLRTFERRL